MGYPGLHTHSVQLVEHHGLLVLVRVPITSCSCEKYQALHNLQLSVSEEGEPGYEYFNNLHNALSMQNFFSAKCIQYVWLLGQRFIVYCHTFLGCKHSPDGAA